MDYAFAVRHVLDEVGLVCPITLVGHSMGGAIGVLLAAMAPERIHKLVLVDNIGFLSRSEDSVVANARKAFKDSVALSKKLARVYPSSAVAAEARILGASRMAGPMELSMGASMTLLERGTRSVDAEGGLCFRHDLRLLGTSPFYFTEPQVLSFLSAIECPTLYLRAENGWPVSSRLHTARVNSVKDIQFEVLPGGHHLHLDDQTAPAVADRIIKFFRE